MNSCFNTFLFGKVQLGQKLPRYKGKGFYFQERTHCLMGEGLFSDPGRTKGDSLLERQPVGLIPGQW